MQESNDQSKILAQALYEIRQLLSGYLGSQNTGDALVRQAAHLSYALHNEALSVIEGRTFDSREALAKVEAVDRMFQQSFARRFEPHIRNKP